MNYFLTVFMFLLSTFFWPTSNLGINSDLSNVKRMPAKDLDCLVVNAFHEAIGEGKIGRLLVTQVVMNRAERASKSFCEIVFQPKQFSWTLGKIKKVPEEVYHNLAFEIYELYNNKKVLFPELVVKALYLTMAIKNNINNKIDMSLFILPETLIICRLIDGNYPNYEAVIPKENPNKLMIDRSLFLSSVRRVAIFSNKTTHQIRLKIAGAELNISAEDIDYSNKAEERLTCDYQGDDMQIGFNSRFLTEMLTNLQSDMIMLEMSLPNRAGILTPVDGLEEGETVTMLVMPVMLNA